MTATPAWQRHGCYKLGSTQYHNFEYGKALFGCDDFSQQLDHFDPTADYFRFLHRVFNLRDTYPSLMDGFQLANQSIHTYFVQFPGSNNTQTEIGLRSMSREPAPRQLNDPEFLTDMATPVWCVRLLRCLPSRPSADALSFRRPTGCSGTTRTRRRPTTSCAVARMTNGSGRPTRRR